MPVGVLLVPVELPLTPVGVRSRSPAQLLGWLLAVLASLRCTGSL
jgi:hypothetical protein